MNAVNAKSARAAPARAHAMGGGRPVPVRIRSLLYVPGHKPDWVPKAIAAGVDAVILDLEDAVPVDRRGDARSAIAAVLRDKPDVLTFVRINALTSSAALDDLEAVVVPGLAGIQIPKIRSAREVQSVAMLLTWLEERRGIPLGATRLLPLIETAEGLADAREIFAASERVDVVGLTMAKDGDLMRSMGFVWGDPATTNWVRIQVLSAARAAGVRTTVAGIEAGFSDDDATKRFAVEHRCAGYDAMILVHPRQVPIANSVFGTDEAALDTARRLVDTFERAQIRGDAALTFEGRMIDIAMVRSAKATLEAAGVLDEGEVGGVVTPGHG